MDLDHDTGGEVAGWPHVMQSIRTILSTHVNSRVFRREFGSDVSALVDAPMNDANLLALYVAVAEAIERWEPRFELTDVQVVAVVGGVVQMTLTGSHRPNAHVGDLAEVDDETRVVRIQRDRAEEWSLAA